MFFVVLSMLVFVTALLFAPVPVAFGLSANDVVIIAQHVLGSYAVVVDVILALPVLTPYVPFVVIDLALRVASSMFRRIIYPMFKRVVVPCVLLVLYLTAGLICEFCVYTYIKFATFGTDMFALLLLISLQQFTRFFVSQSTPITPVIANTKMVTSDYYPPSVGLAPTSVPAPLTSPIPVPPQATASSKTPRLITPQYEFTPEALAREKAAIEAFGAVLRRASIKPAQTATSVPLPKQTITLTKTTVPTTTSRPTSTQAKFTPEALAWEKAVLDAFGSALRSPDCHSTFVQKMAILRTGNVAGRLASAKTA
ncbi:hypothetical protein FRC12_014489 [Ceratobasidium sp. 428]|nr:hypothetical protein FRC12_014489 [Ceratobasidium sp. 428]